ncbi:MAG: hypothetical protein JXR77_11095 [Lentisphaeria bacterium]|nr:hypothetical protein [Lentisphaeria bacterium]
MLSIQDLDRCFPRYRAFEPEVPVWDLTPGLGGCFHRFFDTSPISPSGRFLAVTRFADERRMPLPGEPAEVVLVDLETGRHRVVAETFGWDTQLGAQAQWGKDDRELFFNDMDVRAWRPYGVRFDPATGDRRRLDGTVYMVSPDGTQALSPCLLRTGLTQAGYGVLAPDRAVPRNRGAAGDDGVYVTDTASGRCRLLLSFARIAAAVWTAPRFEAGDWYGFHVKWNPRGTRIMAVGRWVSRQGKNVRPSLITASADGDRIALAVPDTEWADKGGHHPNWCPDGDHVLMNLRIDGPDTPMRFVSARWDGSGLAALHGDILGSGHPSLHPDGHHVVTDCYPQEKPAFGDGTTPIRWADLRTGEVRPIVRVRTVPEFSGPKKERRVDPHPAWDRSWGFVAFNGCPRNVRSVFLADVRSLLAS